MSKQSELPHPATRGQDYGGAGAEIPHTFMGWAVAKDSDHLYPVTFEPRPMDAVDVDIAVRYSGVCGSDIHVIENAECGKIGGESSVFPGNKTIPGHEIAGIVVDAGPEAKFKVGYRVGAGVLADACLKCKECNEGHEQLCKKAVFTHTHPGRNEKGDMTKPIFGGFANMVRFNSNFVHTIPQDVSLEEAATLMCSGLTAYTALRRYGASSKTSIGVLGIGSLGHMVLQFAKAMNCPTILALNDTPVNCEDCLRMGATKCLCNLGESGASYDEARRCDNLDLLFVCSVSHKTNWYTLLHMVRPRGTIVILAMPPSSSMSLNLPAPTLVRREISVVGSFQGGRRDMKEMFDFVVRHKIHPWIVKRPMAEINEALEDVKHHQVRYAMVLEVPKTYEGGSETAAGKQVAGRECETAKGDVPGKTSKDTKGEAGSEHTTDKLKEALEEEVQQMKL
ncbi:hypothetical protein BGZ73_004300 [Actinomortierella ambigua]|nr:hypothetical protein BGZ73_004300 [Actinomortierella ambigua]